MSNEGPGRGKGVWGGQEYLPTKGKPSVPAAEGSHLSVWCARITPREYLPSSRSQTRNAQVVSNMHGPSKSLDPGLRIAPMGPRLHLHTQTTGNGIHQERSCRIRSKPSLVSFLWLQVTGCVESFLSLPAGSQEKNLNMG